MSGNERNKLKPAVGTRQSKTTTRRRTGESLETASLRRRQSPGSIEGRRPRNAGRFTYWLYLSINPWAELLWAPSPELAKSLHLVSSPKDPLAADRVAHAILRDEYAERHEAGDPKAIFEYVSLDTWAFRAAWVVEQIETWRDRDEFAKLQRLMKAYTKGRGRTSLKELYNLITLDQAAFHLIIKCKTQRVSLEDAIAKAAEGDGRSEDSLKRVHQEYLPFYKSVVPSTLSDDEFFAELAKMASRLRPAQGNTQR